MQIFSTILITEQNHTNVRSSTRLSYKMICPFNRYLSYKDLPRLQKEYSRLFKL